ncbi:MAG TPA: hypothetical protein VGR27_13810, partial [Longimicrobiaceae bacterium]|nr:hypothetical protein [Longimicrobiaceae bacterium]
MDDLTLSVESSPRPEDVRLLHEGLDAYNFSYFSQNDYQPLAVFLRNSAGEVVGGVSGGTYWG